MRPTKLTAGMKSGRITDDLFGTCHAVVIRGTSDDGGHTTEPWQLLNLGNY